jgi:hypothetical protein
MVPKEELSKEEGASNGWYDMDEERDELRKEKRRDKDYEIIKKDKRMKRDPPTFHGVKSISEFKLRFQI